MDGAVTEKKNMLVRDIMHHGVPTVKEESTLAEILAVFKLNDCPVVVVVDEFDETSGLIAEIDLVEHYGKAESAALTAEDIMEQRVFTAAPTARVSEVAELMIEKNIEHLVIVHGHGAAKLGSGNLPVALIGAREIVRAMAEEAGV